MIMMDETVIIKRKAQRPEPHVRDVPLAIGDVVDFETFRLRLIHVNTGKNRMTFTPVRQPGGAQDGKR